jgi:hypothetical protein
LFPYLFLLRIVTFECSGSGLSLSFSRKQLACRQAHPKISL